jgi:hypothetical protein
MPAAAPIDLLEDDALPRLPVLAAFVASVALHAAILSPLLAPALAALLDPDEAQALAEFAPDPDLTDPEPNDPDVPLGIERSDAVTLNWIGYEEYEEHLAQLAEFDQAAFRDEDSGGAESNAGVSARPQGLPVPPAPPGDPATPTPPREPDADRPETVVAPPVPPEPVDAGGADRDRGATPEAAPKTPPSGPAPIEGPDAPVPAGPAVPDGESPDRVEPGKDEPPAGTPREEPTPNVDPEVPQPVADPAPRPRPEVEPDATPSPPTDAPNDPAPPQAPEPTPTEEPEPTPTPAPNPNPEETPQPTPTPEDVPSPPAEPKPEGGPPSGEEEPAAPGPPRPNPAAPGDDAPKESDAFSIVDVPAESWRTGKPLAMQGLEIRTRKPVLPLLTQLTTRPRDPIVEMRFDRTGRVVLAKLISSTGHERVDGPILDSLYRWRAVGELLGKLEKDQVYVYRIRLVMR